MTGAGRALLEAGRRAGLSVYEVRSGARQIVEAAPRVVAAFESGFGQGLTVVFETGEVWGFAGGAWGRVAAAPGVD